MRLIDADKLIEKLRDFKEWENDDGRPIHTMSEIQRIDRCINFAQTEPIAYDVNKVIQKLGEYEDLEEQGLLLRLPAEAYFIKDNIVRKGWVQELVYSLCSKLLLDIRYDDNSLDSYRGYLGNDVFLTQAEAEQKLKEMESD